MSSKSLRSAPGQALLALPAAGAAACLLLLGGEAGSQTAAGPFAARGCDHRERIASLPYTITSSGSYYLASDLTGVAGSHGIIVDSDDVSIDLAGHSLTGVPRSLDGIHVTGGPRVHLRVSNGSIGGWGGDGVGAQQAAYSVWQGLRVAGNGDFGLAAAEGALVRECAFDANGESGLWIGRGSIAIQSSSRDNEVYGFRAQGVLADCDADRNGDDGFVLEDAAIARGCRTDDNGAAGILALSEAIVLEAVVGSDAVGIQTAAGDAGASCLVARCRAENGSAGRIQLGSGNYAFDNVVTQASLTDAFLVIGEHARIDSNHASSCSYGFRTGMTASGNLFVRNSASDSGTANYDLLAGNPAGPLVPLPGPGTSWCNFDL